MHGQSPAHGSKALVNISRKGLHTLRGTTTIFILVLSLRNILHMKDIVAARTGSAYKTVDQDQ